MKYSFEILFQVSSQEWDEKLIAIGDCHPYQSSGFAACLALQGSKPQFVEIRLEEKLVGYCLYFLESGRRVTCFHGPVALESVDYKLMTDELFKFWQQQGHSGIEQYSSSISYKCEIPKDNSLPLGNTVVIDLAVPNLLKAMDHSVRKNIRKCQDANVHIEFRDDEEAIKIYLKMLKSHRLRLGQTMPRFYPNFSNLKLGNRGLTRFVIALASLQGRYLSGMGFIALGSTVTEVAVAQSDEYFRQKLPAQDLIKLRAMEYFSVSGVRFYDLAGIANAPKNEKEENIRRFKLKFSKEIRSFSKVGRTPFRPAIFWPSLLIEKARRRIQVDTF